MSWLLCCPSYDSKISLELVPFLREAKAHWMPIAKTPTDVARNAAVSMAQLMKCHLCMVDSDAMPAKGTWDVFAKKVEQEVCACAVPYVSAFNQICVGANSPRIQDVENLSGWQKVDGLGTHCCFFNLKCFEALEPPYFEYHYNTNHTSLAGYAEDTVLFNKLRHLGIPLYTNYSYWADHIVPKTLGKPHSLTEMEKALILAT